VVDSTTGRVFLFGTQTGGSYVVQTDTALTVGSVEMAQIGTGVVNGVHPGTPDNNYFTSVSTGRLYACGQNTSGEAQLYAFGFNSSGVMSTTAATGSPLAMGNTVGANAPCTAAITEVFDQSAAKDHIYLGVKDRCLGTSGGTNGCIMSFDVTSSGTFPTTFTNSFAVVGGTSGIAVDNVTDATATELTTDVYFVSPGGQSCTDYNGSAHTGNCAFSLTQKGLQ
jgi:hypothetical protein